MSAIATPCIKVCAIDPASHLCSGCGRTLEEIGTWLRLTPDERITVMGRLPARLAALRSGQTPVPHA